ncbi:MAG: class I SAM-dependent methyltransferase, partial [Dehalococcoidia bacterium]|nr:class I SAM-dependent methyltransferase [Dehalococcoidia bacterium]
MWREGIAVSLEDGISPQSESARDALEPTGELFIDARFRALILRHVPIGPNLRVVDVRCGVGALLFEVAHMLGPTATLVGVDPSREALARAEATRARYGLTNVSFRHAPSATIDLPDASCDLVVANLRVNRAANQAALFAECGRIVAPGGALAIATTVQGAWHEFVTLFRGVLAEYNDARALELLAQDERQLGTAASVCARVEAGGFR